MYSRCSLLYDTIIVCTPAEHVIAAEACADNNSDSNLKVCRTQYTTPAWQYHDVSGSRLKFQQQSDFSHGPQYQISEADNLFRTLKNRFEILKNWPNPTKPIYVLRRIGETSHKSTISNRLVYSMETI